MLTNPLILYPNIKCFTSNGGLAVGYLLYAYKAGTSTATTTYSDHLCTVANTWPVVTNAIGEAVIYVKEPIKLVLKDSTGAQIWERNYLGGDTAQPVIGTVVPVTTDNNYVVTTTSGLTSLVDGMTLVFSPDLDNQNTLVLQPDGRTVAFTGTGIDDLTVTGPYIGTTSGSVFTFEVTAGGVFKWKKDGGSWTTGVTMPTVKTALIEGLYYLFAVDAGHTVGDIWTVTVITPVTVNVDSLDADLVYKNVGGVIQSLDGGDMKANYPSQLVYSGTESAWILTNPQAPVLTGPYLNATRYRKVLDADYTLLYADQGYELSFQGSHALTLLPAANFANRFFYVGSETGTTTINVAAGAPGTDLIYGPEGGTGVASYTLYSTGTNRIQLASNGVDWHIMTTATVGAESHVWYELSAGTNGQNVIATTWTQLNINTESDVVGMVSVAANQFTLPQGNYSIEAKVPFYCATSYIIKVMLRLKNVTATSYQYGMSQHGYGFYDSATATYNAGGTVHLDVKVAITASTVFQLEIYANDGIQCSKACDFGVVEKYNFIRITRTL